jgi:HAD superfamily hydrolase (TIGR01450 family)
MGSRMARRVLDAGWPLTVWNRTRSKMVALTEAGAEMAETPASAAAGADIVISMVTDAGALRAVTEGRDGVLAGARAGTTLIDMSTVGPRAVALLASRLPDEFELVDAPVLGSLAEAEAGSLTIFAGGSTVLVERVTSVLSAMGSVVHVGGLGSGSAAKLVANASLFNVLGALGEALCLADALGLSRETTYRVLEATPLAAQAARRRPAIEANEYPPRFPLALARKDVAVIAEAARTAADTDVRMTQAAGSWLADADQAGWGTKDYSAVLAYIAEFGQVPRPWNESLTQGNGDPTPVEFDGLIVDLDGVIWRGNDPIPGATEAIATLRASGTRVLFLTNEPSRSRAQFAVRLTEMGIPAAESDVMTSSVATARAASASAGNREGRRAYVIGPDALREEVRAEGFDLLSPMEAAAADVVVVGGHDAFGYGELRAATVALRGGARLFATGRDAVFPTADGLAPGTGAVIAAVETAGGAIATVVGKPEASIFAAAREALGNCAHVAMVGDHLIADIAGAKRAGLAAILVLTGVTSREDLEGAAIAPDVVLDSVSDLPGSLASGRSQEG